MDGSSFDKLSVSIHRLREQASRRNALRLLAGGTVAAVAGAIATETDAKKKKKHKKHKKKNCRNGFGGRCNSNRDCCNGRCRNGFCWYTGNGGGGGNGGQRCNGVRCPNGWRCCYFQGWQRCLPETHAACTGSGECPFTWDTCGWNGSIRKCCGVGQKCCYSDNLNMDICLPDGADCDDFNRSASVEGQSISSIEGASEPIPVTDIDPSEYE
jgi:hypothetical protein